VATLASKSVPKKLRDKAFAAKVDRHELATGAAVQRVELPDHIEFIIGALSPHDEELGIGPRA